MNEISYYLHYLPATSDPLSGDVYIIEGGKFLYVFDVGSTPEVANVIENLPKEKVIILSHPHNDHIGNVDDLTYKDLYVGDATFEKIGKGTVIDDEVTINDGVRIQIRHCQSPHTDGSLIVTVNSEYTLLADLYFTRRDYNREKAKEMLDVLRTIETKYFVVSHQEAAPVFEKDWFLQELSAYFQ